MSTQNTLKSQYTTDSRCLRCDAKFGFGLMKYVKKHWCKFCGRGVCSNCSPQKVPNPETSRIDRICNLCYQRVMTDHFKKTLDQEIEDLKKQRSEYYFSLGQEIRNRAKICTKKRILEGILQELENEAERKDREQRTILSKLKTEKDNKLMRMESLVKKHQETQRELEKKEKKLKESENEGFCIKERIIGEFPELEELWNLMKELRNKKIKLIKKGELVNAGFRNTENENFTELGKMHDGIVEENKQLMQELSELTAELEIKEQKIRSLQKKIVEATINCVHEEEIDASSELKKKIEEQRKVITELNGIIILQQHESSPIISEPCKCLLF